MSRSVLVVERLRSRAIRTLRGWQRSHPPRIPRGYVLGPPDFVGVGAQKSGTTWWYSLIEQHPQVQTRRTPKELHYFDRPHPRKGSYREWFPRRPGTICGEWTPTYMIDPVNLDGLLDAAPDARLFVLVRDPIERYRAGFTMAAKSWGWSNERSMIDARRRGLYATQLEDVFARYAREQVLVLQYEACVADPERELVRTFAHLGLDAYRPEPEYFARKRNAARFPKLDLSPDEHQELLGLFQPEVARLHELVPDLELDLWPNFARVGR